ncbi:uncharacterized protein TNCV_3715461 [Trichonephila clavipes]|nr:uncharacterized protein TNCV_3715461 [Trichonephila clavipes]
MGKVLESIDRFDEALLHYRRAIEIQPEDVRSYINVGRVLTNLRRYKDAEDIYRKKRSVKSRRKQQSAFDQVSEFDRGRIMAYRDCGLSFREIGSRVGQNQTTLLRICDRRMQEVTTDRRVVDRIQLSAPLHVRTGKLCAWQ